MHKKIAVKAVRSVRTEKQTVSYNQRKNVGSFDIGFNGRGSGEMGWLNAEAELCFG